VPVAAPAPALIKSWGRTKFDRLGGCCVRYELDSVSTMFIVLAKMSPMSRVLGMSTSSTFPS
jgi:hypothetical protein